MTANGDSAFGRCPICGGIENVKVYAPHSVRRHADPRFISLFTDQREIYCEATDEERAFLSHHEAGHVVAGIALGFGIEYATIGGDNAHVVYKKQNGRGRFFYRLIKSAAGDAAAAIYSGEQFAPLWAELRRSVERSRTKMQGQCDRCVEANLLIQALPELTNLEIIDAWYDVIDITMELFSDSEWREAVETVAVELNERTLLHGNQVEALVSRFDLAPAVMKVLEPLNLMMRREGNCMACRTGVVLRVGTENDERTLADAIERQSDEERRSAMN